MLNTTVRRTAEIMFIDSDDTDTQNAKNNLYTQSADGSWNMNRAISHRTMSNNSIIYEKKPTREFLHEHFQKMRMSGEPGIVNAESARKRRPDFIGTNPCFTGDMKLLTADGYKTFESMDGQDIPLVNKDGRVTDGKVWCSGVKPVWEIKFLNRPSITCTDNHVFLTVEGEEVEAKDLRGKRIMPFLGSVKSHDKEFVELGFLQGDGNLSRLSRPTHRGLEINLGKNDGDVRSLFGLSGVERSVYINGFNERLMELGFSHRTLPERGLPKTIDSWSEVQIRSFLRGLYSANGSVLGCGRITLKSTCSELLEGVKELLKGLGIESYITTNKSKKVKFSNGEYQCRESYDLNIHQFFSREIFFREVGFIQEYKTEKLKKTLMETAPSVISVKDTGRVEKVYDFTEPELHWGVVEGVIAHNCGEILLQSKNVCNLTTMNMMAFVVNGLLAEEALMESVRLTTRAGYRMTNVTLELHQWDRNQKQDRLLGVSMTGYQEMIGALGYTREQEIALLRKMREVSHKAMREIAMEMGLNESLLVTTVKPEGSLSQVFGGVSSGLHFPHSEYYIRRIRINSGDPLCKVAEDLGWSIKPEVGQDWDTASIKVIELPVHSTAKKFKAQVSAIEQLEVYKMFQQEWTDHNSSITVHVRDHEWLEVEEWIWENWDEFVGVSFLSYNDSFYQLLPYEECTREQYEELLSRTKRFVPSMLKKYETSGVSELDANEACADGACAVR